MSIFIAGTDCHPPKKMLALLSIMFKLAVIVTTLFWIATGCSTRLRIMTEPTVWPRHTIHLIFAAGGIFMDKSALLVRISAISIEPESAEFHFFSVNYSFHCYSEGCA